MPTTCSFIARVVGRNRSDISISSSRHGVLARHTFYRTSQLANRHERGFCILSQDKAAKDERANTIISPLDNISEEESDTTRWLESNKQGERITIVGAGVNLVMAGLKGVTGVCANSPGMIADAGHSLSDLASDGVAYFAFKQARKPADAAYLYGYGKFEAVGSAACALLIMGAGVGIGMHSVEILTSLASAEVGTVEANSLLHAATPSFLEDSSVTPLQLAMGAALASIASKEVSFGSIAPFMNLVKRNTPSPPLHILVVIP